MSAADVCGYVVDLHGADRPRLVEFVIQSPAQGEAKPGITGRDVDALTQNAGLRTAAAMGNTREKTAERYKPAAFAIKKPLARTETCTCACERWRCRCRSRSLTGPHMRRSHQS